MFYVLLDIKLKLQKKTKPVVRKNLKDEAAVLEEGTLNNLEYLSWHLTGIYNAKKSRKKRNAVQTKQKKLSF